MSGLKDSDYGSGYHNEGMDMYHNRGGYDHHHHRSSGSRMSSADRQESAARGAAEQDSKYWKNSNNHYLLDFSQGKWFQFNAQNSKSMGPMPMGNGIKDHVQENAHFYFSAPKDKMKDFSANTFFADVEDLTKN